MQVFTLYSSVFFRVDNEKAVFYNTDSFCAKTFKTTPMVREICHLLSDIDNLYTIPITEERREFCIKLCESGFGKLHDDTDLCISFPPSLTLRNDWDKIKSIEGQDAAEVLKYLSEVTLYMGGRQDVENTIFYQTEYPSLGNNFIDYAQLINFIHQVSNRHKINLKFIFPFVEGYPNISKMLRQIKQLKNKCGIFVRDSEYYSSHTAQTILKDIQANIVVINDSRQLFSSDISDSVFNRFLIFDKKGTIAVQELVERKALTRYSFVAVYDGANEQFIKDASFPTEKELLNGAYTRKHLFAHQVLNTFCFGRISITPDGNVYSNLMEEAIGTINSPLHSLVKTELNNNYSWRKTRHIKPNCCKCRLLDLCPSISPLESYMGVNCIIKRLF